MFIKNTEVKKLIDNGYLPYPVKIKSKRPDIKTGKKPEWLTEYKDQYLNTTFHGVGIFPQHGLNCVDYDLTPKALIKEGFTPEQAEEIFTKIDPIAQQILEKAIVSRTGSKGYAALFNGEEDKKTVLKIKAPNGQDVTIIDLMRNTGVGVVMPPTIHPDTKKPYRWLTEKTLFNTRIDEHPPLPVDLLNQIFDICEKYSPKKQKKVRKTTTKKVNSNELKVSASSDVQHLPMDTIITLDSGAQVELWKALEDNVGEYCFDPLRPDRGPKKAIINSSYIHIFNSSQTRLYPAPPDLICEETKEAFYSLGSTGERIKEAQKHTGIDLARWVFLIGKTKVYRFGFDWPMPYEWMKAYFPKIEEKHAKHLKGYFHWLMTKREKESLRYYTLKKPNLVLKWKDGKLPWHEAIEASKNHKLVVVRAEHGSGKTSVFAKAHATKDSLIIAHRVSLTEQLCDTLGADHYQEHVRATGKLVTCVHSLTQEKRVKPYTQNVRTVVIDEAGQLRKELPSIEKKADEVYNEKARVLRQAEKVVCLDADFSDKDIEFYEGLTGCKAYIIEAEPSDKAFNTHLRVVNKGLGDTSRISQHLNTGQACVAPFSSAEKARLCYEQLKLKHPDKNIVLCTRTPDGAGSVEEMKKNPEAFFSDVDCVLYSSTIGTGFSIENPRFTKGFCFFNNSPLAATDCIQTMRRFRAITDFDITLQINHRHTECYQKTFTSEGLIRLKDEVSLQENHDKAYFLTALKKLLQNRGHRITEDSANIVKLPREAMVKSDANIIASFGHTTQESPIVDDHTYYQSHRYKCQELFSYSYGKNRTITNEMALAYCEDRWTLERYQQLTSPSPEGDLIQAQEIFRELLKERLFDNDCENIMKSVREHQNALARLDLLPYQWVGRGIPKHYTRGCVAELAEFWGVSSEIKPYKESYTIRISISPIAAMIQPLTISTKADKKAQALELLEQGLSKAKVAEIVNVSKDTVKRWARVKGVQKDALSTNSINTLIDDSASKCTPTGERYLNNTCSYQQTPSLYTAPIIFDGVGMIEHEQVELPNTEPFCPIQELEQQKDLEVLPEDKSFVRDMLDGQGEPERQIIIHGYINAWRAGCLSEPRPHCKQNAGRLSANDWLHKEVRRQAHRL